MKTIKKLVLGLLVTSATVGSFTSCVENEIPEEIQNIYDGQASLLKARALLNEAEANFRNAQAAHENALAKAQEITNSFAEAKNALELEKLEAQAALAVEQARLDLEKAKIAFEKEANDLRIEILKADEALLTKYYNSYKSFNDKVFDLRGNEIDKQEAIAKQIIANTLGTDSHEVALARLNNEIKIEEAKIATLEESRANYEALIANGSDAYKNNEKKKELEAKSKELSASLSQIKIAVQEKKDEISVAEDDLTAMSGDVSALETALTTARTTHKNKASGLDALVEDNKKQAETIAEAKEDLKDYTPAGLAALEKELEDAKAALKAATADVEKLTKEETALTAVRDAAQELKNKKQTTSDDILADLKAANDNYLNEKAKEKGKEKEVKDKETEVTKAQKEYDTAKGLFEANPTGSTYTDENAGDDKALGNHDDDAKFTTTYVEILSIGAKGAVLGTTQITDATKLPKGKTTLASGTAYKDIKAGDVGKYFDIEADDVAPSKTNKERFEAAALDLSTKQKGLITLEKELRDLKDDIAEYKTNYEQLLATSESINDELKAAVLALEKAESDLVAVTEALEDAESAKTEAEDLIDDLNNGTTGRLTNFESLKKALETAIQNAEDAILVNNVKISNLEIEIAKLEAEIAELVEKIAAGTSPEVVAAKKAIDALKIEQSDLEAEQEIIQKSFDQTNNVISIIGSDYVTITDLIKNANTSIKTTNSIIASLKQKIADSNTAEAANAAMLSKLESDLVEIQENITFYSALVAKYKGLIDSLI